MQTNFHVQWVPLPAEREGEWRHAIEMIAKIIKVEFDRMDRTPFPYRLAWQDPSTGCTYQGTPLFQTPEDAKETKAALESMFPTCEVWVEPVDK